ncbi:DUF4158 domain-containing protein [Pseudarthrobacter albicanus]|uniref:DUF4158 domain-containing protein n=1 Tax=Pseudarthrobacter albicanus TaxID=2823873 RepID=UPI001BA94696
MAGEHLTAPEEAAYGRYAHEAPDRPVLARFFFLDDLDRELVANRRGDHNRLGFGLQLVTVRHLGVFLDDPVDVPTAVVFCGAGRCGGSVVCEAVRGTEADSVRAPVGDRRRHRRASQTTSASTATAPSATGPKRRTSIGHTVEPRSNSADGADWGLNGGMTPPAGT